MMICFHKKGEKIMEARELLIDIYDTTRDVRDVLEALQNALIYNSAKPLERSLKSIEEIERKIKNITAQVKDQSKTSPEISAYISIPDHLEKITEHLENIASRLKEKISRDVLFNDKSISELNFVMEKVRELLNNTSDIVLVKNTIILGYVKESEASISMTATDYETSHEEHLIDGTAPTKPSILFIDILISLKSIAWHIRGIAEDIFA